MSSNSSLKYVARKGRDLNLDDFREVQVGKKRKSFFSTINKLLFGNPAKAFSVLIIFIALPITVYIVLRGEKSIVKTQADQATLILKPSKIQDLETNQANTIEFNATGRNIKDLETLEIIKPNWLQKTSETDLVRESKVSKTLFYSGRPGSNITDRFALLSKAQVEAPVKVCNGCDTDKKYVYSLSEFSLNTKQCSGLPVWGRNPVGGDLYCQKFSNECLIPITWKRYETEEQCKNTMNKPEDISNAQDEIFTFTINCDGLYEEQSFDYKNKIKVTDSDGDIVRFSVDSREDIMKLYQDSYETIIKQVSGQKGYNYFTHSYEALLQTEIRNNFIGNTFPVIISACDGLGNCTSSDIGISAIQRSNCSLMKSEVFVNISNWEEWEILSGVSDLFWEMKGADEYFAEVNLYDETCSEFIRHLSKYDKLDLGESKGYSYKWDTGSVDDGNYCLGIISGENSYGNIIPTSDFEKLSISNDNESPVFRSEPDKANLVTGEDFEYNVEVVDPDGDMMDLEIIHKPDWLQVDGWKITGSTVIPGNYTFSLAVDDGVSQTTVQIINLNIKPPEKSFPELNIFFPQEGNVLSGESNPVKWNVQDEYGVSLEELSYSDDGKRWYLIKSLTNEKSEYVWDVSEIPSGSYFLKIEITDNSDLHVKYSIISDRFFISNEDDNPKSMNGDIDVFMPSINNITPEYDSETFSRRPLISAGILPSGNSEIVLDSLEVLVDDKNIKDSCDITEKDVLCNITEELEYGKHKVRISFLDNNSKLAVQEWFFTINEENVSVFDKDVIEDDVEIMVILPLTNIEVEKWKVTTIGLVVFTSIFLVFIVWLLNHIVKLSQKRRIRSLLRERNKKANLDELSSINKKSLVSSGNSYPRTTI